MRIIKFRGQSKFTTHEWLYGNLVELNGKFFIIPKVGKISIRQYEVIPETIGQFTGLTNKNGVEIYEGDIIKIDVFTKTYEIVFGESGKWGASFQYKSDSSIYYLTELFAKDCFVTGNIHER